MFTIHKFRSIGVILRTDNSDSLTNSVIEITLPDQSEDSIIRLAMQNCFCRLPGSFWCPFAPGSTISELIELIIILGLAIFHKKNELRSRVN